MHNFSGPSGRDLSFGTGAQAPSWTMTPYGYGIAFGGNDYMATDVLDGTILNLVDGVIFSCRANPPNADQAVFLLAHLEPDSPYHQIVLGISGGWDSGNLAAGQRLSAWVYAGDVVFKYTVAAVCDGGFHDYAAVYKYGVGIDLYVDGLRMAQSSDGDTWSSPTNDRRLTVGARDTTGDHGFAGTVTDIWCANNPGLGIVDDPCRPYRRRSRLPEWIAAMGGASPPTGSPFFYRRNVLDRRLGVSR